MFYVERKKSPKKKSPVRDTPKLMEPIESVKQDSAKHEPPVIEQKEEGM